MNFFNYEGNGTVKVQHRLRVRPLPGEKGHLAYVPLVDITPMAGHDDTLVVRCPVDGCATESYVPLTGTSEAQMLHAQWRWANGQCATLADAIDEVIQAVTDRGFTPYIHHKLVTDHVTGAANSFMMPSPSLFVEKEARPTGPSPEELQALIARLNPTEQAAIFDVLRQAATRLGTEEQSAAAPPVDANPYVTVKPGKLGEVRLQ